MGLTKKINLSILRNFKALNGSINLRLVGKLPAGTKQSIWNKPELLEARRLIERLKDRNADKQSINAERLKYKNW